MKLEENNLTAGRVLDYITVNFLKAEVKNRNRENDKELLQRLKDIIFDDREFVIILHRINNIKFETSAKILKCSSQRVRMIFKKIENNILIDIRVKEIKKEFANV